MKLFSSLRFRLSLIIILAILPSIVLNQYSNQEDKQREIDAIKEDTLNITRIIAEQEGALLDGTRQLLLSLSISDGVRDFDQEKCSQILANLIPHFRRYINFGVADLHGEVVCSALPVEEVVNIADRKYFTQALALEDFAIGEYQVGRITHKPTINLGYPVYDDRNNLFGVIYAAIDLEILSQFEENIQSKLQNGGILTKVDHDGIVLASIPLGENIVGNPFPEISIIKDAFSSGDGLLEKIDVGGRTWIYALSILPRQIYQDDILVIYAIPEEVLLARVNHIFNRNLYIMLGVGIILIIGSLSGLEFYLMRQIRSLLDVTRHLIQGDLEARSEIYPHGSLELNEFASLFNSMSASLEKREQELLQVYDSTLLGWSLAMDLRDKQTEGHTHRVTGLTVRLAREMGLSEEEIVQIRRGALLHDIGKLGVPDYILHKPGKLTEEEWALMRQHPQFAYDMLSSIDYLRPALDIPYYHHEMWDGSGYPLGLQGDEIPLSARIFTVVDVWDALRSDRPYRKAWPMEKVFLYIKDKGGSHFDPTVVEIFLKTMKENEQFDLLTFTSDNVEN